MEKRYMFKLFFGIVIMLIGVLAAAFNKFNMSASIFMINLGLIIVILTIIRSFRQGEFPDKDERTKKLAAYGITYSWLLTLVLIAVLYWVEYLNLVELTAVSVLGILLIFMSISAHVFRWYFLRKGDVE